ncbi:GntR family transcriptional regulator [Undibacterium arcticum]|uniref:GntR family transcriptional regulator n=1 Tax=Undibacterium arcticum TaxID=1762892 RepID=A0ABV7EXV2_9BURK
MEKLNSADRRGQIPAYIQVASALRRRIETGEWLPGRKISTLEELEQEFNFARVTVRQAVGLLEKEGLVTRQQGRGTFVNEHVNDKRWLRLETTWESVITSIKENVPKFIKVATPPPFPKLHEDEGSMASEYVFLRSVQLKDGVPYAVVNLHLARDIFDQNRDAFLKHTALSVLATLDSVDIKEAHQTLVIGTADRETANLLQVSLSVPTAECRCVVTDQDDVAIYVAEITYRSDCMKLYMNLLDRVKPTPKALPRTRKMSA